MKKEYFLVVFLVCFFIWAAIVDNVVLPSHGQLQERVGTFTRYRVKDWKQVGKLDLLKDELIIYARVKDREQFFYLEHQPHFEATLKNMEPGTPLKLGYVERFPKVWKKKVYQVQANGSMVMQFSPLMLKERQAFIWKFSGAVVGVFALLCVLAYINKPRRR